ncbi:MAG TPA: hypothetical protein VNB24_08135 [Acidimicrobiales bacterium]|nr:hypothetical protein [Acidimicrobiales bacterium]
MATLAIGVVGFAPTSSAQTLGGCAEPDVCGFINASGFSAIGFANGTFGFIGPNSPFFGGGTFSNNNVQSTVAPPAPNTNLGQWTFGSMPLSTGFPTFTR